MCDFIASSQTPKSTKSPVGIGATNKEFLIPCLTMSDFNESQSHKSVGLRFHKSNCNRPCEAGEPLKVSYGPSTFANSTEASKAAWYIVSNICTFSSLAFSDSNGSLKIIKASAKP
ncbi:hypothetical protein WICMUC_001884 [Wickerhamomyces mucosus]|uniref:Uncharacterized protein n=1 Tax=Wickerhamomyces mucosus TaxID=1378264 RepID=A0A9P8PTQ4_9ASCO|nr:hypothetical protein WICMUC_001884 [Wickerhamomyces mucosus]